MKKSTIISLFTLLSLVAINAQATTLSEKIFNDRTVKTCDTKIKCSKSNLYLTAKEAYNLKKEYPEIPFIDVRTYHEANYVGMATLIDVMIPVIKINQEFKVDTKKVFAIESDTNFIPTITAYLESKKINKDMPIILMCRSGDRSATASDILNNLGYKNVYSVYDGFSGDKVNDRRNVNGWQNSGLPWTYSLKQDWFWKK